MDEKALWVSHANKVLSGEKSTDQFLRKSRKYITYPLKSNPGLFNLTSWEQIRTAFLKALEVESIWVAQFLSSFTDKLGCFLGWVPINAIQPIIEYFANVIDRKQCEYWIYASQTMNNLSYIECARDKVRSCGVVDQLLFMRAHQGSGNNDKLNIFITNSLALLLGHMENNKALTVDDSMISKIIKYMKKLRKKSKKMTGGDLWEVLMPLASLVKADQNKKVIAKYHKEIFACVTGEDNFEDFMQDKRTRGTICQVIEQLSFLKPMQVAILSDDVLTDRLKKFAKTDISCAGILLNIQNTSEMILSQEDISIESRPRASSPKESHPVPVPSKDFTKPPEVQRWLNKVGVTQSVLNAARELGLDGAWLHYYQTVAKTHSMDDFCRISKEFFPDMTMVDVFKLGGWMIE